MTDLFLFGTLRHQPLLQRILGEEGALPALEPAFLPGHDTRWVAGRGHPVLVDAPEARAEGLLARDVSPAALDRLAFYEAGQGYHPQTRTVETQSGPVAAQVWLPQHAVTPGGTFDLSDWQMRWADVADVAAAEVMSHFGQSAPDAVAKRYLPIRARAAARVNARQSAPTTLRRHAAREDVEVIRHRQAYAHFFSVEEYELRHRKFDGSISAPLDRAVFVSTDAVTVLPYDPVRDRVLLIEQFRMGPFGRGDQQCWSLEAIAGRIEPGEPTEETARREAMEEAGLEIGEMRRIGSYYASPGAKSEYIFSYLALCDLPDSAAGLGGLLSEGEDIRAHVISYDHAMALLQSGEVENSPLMVSLQWLALHREELRASA
ncbi:ADP-ribose pyrophosphatase [Actibacterium atlanticum]|uniref:ADP-ribose pyrophosphatase n=1 Tax=Actibacterium atlanticum TaxID=1461693 RepID=A0A058ZKQ7_9RHOB|nr:NUDIX domain-containing protein [Actibacterium atlanticum]KCV81790.1 ADP-ribose pyrophosphatase [Actibacterium atlanticum]